MSGAILSIILPVVVLVLAAAALPRVLARAFGRRPWALVLNAALSALVLLALAGGLFLTLYAVREPRVLSVAWAEPVPAALHFAGLGALAGLIWAPVLAVSLISLPRRR